ncbi:FG-GAP-like repeat-containing protein [Streptomyces sp. PmtG]
MTRARRRARLTTPLIAMSLLTGGLTIWSLGQGQAEAATPAAAKAAVKAGDDFNGDGYADLAVGAPEATVSGKKQAGYVAVTYGSKNGLSPANKKLISRSTSGIPGSATTKQRFGNDFAKGDLDKDGYSDLVIGSGRAVDGAVILWGSKQGLTGATKIDKLGSAPQIGDFDGDGTADLALLGGVATHGDDPVDQPANLWKGPISRTGKPTAVLDFMDKSQWWGYGEGSDCSPEPGLPQSCVDGPRSVSGPTWPQAVGDINGDGRDDMATSYYSGDGEVGNTIMYGSPTGFKRGDRTSGSGGELAVGDINGDRYDDLVIGQGSEENERVVVSYGSKDGLTGNTQRFDQDYPGIPGAQEFGDGFGAALAVADIDGDGYAEIAVGAPGEGVGSLKEAGSVVVVRGSASGVTGTGSQVFHQNTAGVPGAAEKGDLFGAGVALADVNGDGRPDLAASATGENAAAGALWSLPGTSAGVTAKKSVAFGPKDLGAPYTAAKFGTPLR